MWAYMLLVACFVKPIFADTGNSETFTQYEDLASAIDVIAENHDGSMETYLVNVAGETITVADFELDQEIPLGKRWNAHNAPLGASWTNYNVSDQGVFWADWKPATCVQENGSDSPQKVSLKASWSTSEMHIAGFNVKYGIEQAAASGHKVGKKSSGTQTIEVTLPAYTKGQLFMQQQIVWQDQHSQKCHKKHYGKGGIKCGEWLGPFRGELPVLSTNGGLNIGYSTGDDHVNQNECGPGA
ncbi:hypothetical protein OXX79_003548 [Metschnikowia pulcherrima]